MQNEMIEAPPSHPESLGRLIGRIAGIIGSENFPSRELATLKRLAPHLPPTLAFYRFCFMHMQDADLQRNIGAWQTILAGMAIMGKGAHNSDHSVGKVLAEHRYSEARLERLFRAQDDVLYTLTLRVARFLAAKGESVNWWDLAQLLLAKDREKREEVRLRIAGDYYRNQKTDN